MISLNNGNRLGKMNHVEENLRKSFQLVKKDIGKLIDEMNKISEKYQKLQATLEKVEINELKNREKIKEMVLKVRTTAKKVVKKVKRKVVKRKPAKKRRVVRRKTRRIKRRTRRRR